MRIILIEEQYNPNPVHVNVDNISWVGDNGVSVQIGMVCGRTITTKFTDVQHALDYIKRAETIKLTQE